MNHEDVNSALINIRSCFLFSIRGGKLTSPMRTSNSKSVASQLPVLPTLFLKASMLPSCYSVLPSCDQLYTTQPHQVWFFFPRVAKEVEEHMLGWNIPEEHQDMVHEHWRNFPAVSKYWHYCLALIYTMLMITSLTGNGIVIWIFGTWVRTNFYPGVLFYTSLHPWLRIRKL